MDVSKIPPGRNPPDDIHAVIEIPQGGVPVKYDSTRCREPYSSIGFCSPRCTIRQTMASFRTCCLKMATHVIAWRFRN
jgi:hypothetical protein